MRDKQPPKIPGRNGPTPPRSERPDPTPTQMCAWCGHPAPPSNKCSRCGRLGFVSSPIGATAAGATPESSKDRGGVAQRRETPAMPRPMCGACHNQTRVGHGCEICGFATFEDGVVRYVEPFAKIPGWKLPPPKRVTPDYCPRAIDGCMPLHAIRASDHTTFICCGLQREGQSHDPYRMCFKSETTDTMFDHDEFDLLDMIEVATRAMSTHKRFSECEVETQP